MLPVQKSKFEKGLLPFAPLRSKVLEAMLVAFVSGILWRRALVTVFQYFLENKNRFEQKNFTTFIDSPQGICEQKIKVVDFVSMCHIFPISRGLQKNSLLSTLTVFSFTLLIPCTICSLALPSMSLNSGLIIYLPRSNSRK